MIQQILRSKTMMFALALAILGVLQASMDVFTPYLTPQASGLLTVLLGLLVAILRVLTTQKLSDK